MSLNNLRLTPFLVAQFFPNSLVTEGDTVNIIARPEQVAPGEPDRKKNLTDDNWIVLGDNKKKVLVVVNYKNVVHIPDGELGFLTNVLTACGLSLGDVAIINYQHYTQTPSSHILARFHSKTVLLFGLDPIDFGLAAGFPHFQVQMLGGVNYLYAPTLEEASQDALVKSKLWMSLKALFGI